MTDLITYSVPAMHWAHCERAVISEVSQVAGVESVVVDLETKRVTVHGAGMSDSAVRIAIDEAGYEALP